MSSNSVVLNSGNQAIVNYDVSKTFIGNNRYETFQYTNGTGSEATLSEGLLMGRISASGKVQPLASAASDGSQFPIGILATTYKVANAATVNVTICVAGDVAQEKVVLSGSDTLDTVISARRIRDRIGADTVGVKLVVSTELSGYDNQ